eukprot:gene1046-1134_t
MDVVLSCIQVCNEMICEFQKAQVFVNQLHLLQDYLQSTLLPILTANEKKLSNNSLRGYFGKLKEDLEKILRLTKSFVESDPINRTFSRDSIQRELDQSMQLLTQSIHAIVLSLSLDAGQSLQHIQSQLVEAKREDEKLFARITSIDSRISEMEQRTKKSALIRLQHGDIYASLQMLASSEVQDGKSIWLETLPNYFNFQKLLQSISARLKIKSQYESAQTLESTVGNIRQLAMTNISKVLSLIEDVPPHIEKSEISHGLNATCTDYGKRLKDFKLSVCFVGPTKAGKSTCINALLGAKFLPTNTLPCTVIPTVLRHQPLKAGMKRQLTLCLPPKLLEVVSHLRAYLHERRDQLKTAGLTADENLVLEQSLNLSSDYFQSSIILPDNEEGVTEIQKRLGIINHMFRIFSRWGKETGNHAINPLSELIKGQDWPVVLMTFEVLANESFVGDFEIVDCPGRDEPLIQEIVDVVTCVIENASGVVCVLNSTTLGNEATDSIKKVLNRAKASHAPTYILANKIDSAKCLQKEEIEEHIFREFLSTRGKKSPSKSQQVFGVSGELALGAFITQTVISRSEENGTLPGILRNIPLVASTSNTKDWPDISIQRETMEVLISTLVHSRGNHFWKKHKNPDMLLEGLRDGCGYLLEDSFFIPFLNKLMRELAPSTGLKTLREAILQLKLHLEKFINNLDDNIVNTLEGEEKFDLAMKKWSTAIEVLDRTIKIRLPDVMSTFLERVLHIENEREKMIAMCMTLVEKFITHLKNDTAFSIIQGFQLLQPPDEAKLKSLKSVRSKNLERLRNEWYWETTDNQTDALQNQLVEYAKKFHKAMSDILEQWILDNGQPSFRKNVDLFYSEIERILKETPNCGNKVLGSLTRANFSIKVEPLKTPSMRGFGSTDSQTQYHRTWYVLYLFKIPHTEEKTHHVTLGEYTQFLREMVKEAVGQTLKCCHEQAKKFIQLAADTCSNFVQKQIDDVRSNITNLKEGRKQGHNKDMLAKMTRTRVLLDAIRLDNEWQSQALKRANEELEIYINRQFREHEMKEDESGVAEELPTEQNSIPEDVKGCFNERQKTKASTPRSLSLNYIVATILVVMSLLIGMMLSY